MHKISNIKHIGDLSVNFESRQHNSKNILRYLFAASIMLCCCVLNAVRISRYLLFACYPLSVMSAYAVLGIPKADDGQQKCHNMSVVTGRSGKGVSYSGHIGKHG